MSNLSRFSNRPPLSQSHSAMNSKPLSRTTNTSSVRKIPGRPSPMLSGKKSNNNSFVQSSQLLKPVNTQADDNSKFNNKANEQENLRPGKEVGFEELLKSTSNNIGELRSELLKLETSYLKLENSRPGLQLDMPKQSSDNPYLQEYKNDLLKELKEENHKLTIAEMKLHGDFERVREQNKSLETENVSFRDRIAAEKAQFELKELTIEKLKLEKYNLERSLMDMEKAKAEKERESISIIVEINKRQADMQRLGVKLEYEKEEKQKFIADLRNEIEKNSRLQLDNEKLKAEGKNLFEMIESLKSEMQILKRNNEETLKYIQYS